MISSRHYTLKDPNPENPFERCELGREKYAKILTSIIENYEDGFVLAINNKWGEGKTEFIRMWKVYLEMEERKFQTIYFNAWEHDFNRDPLTALLSELKELKIGKDNDFKSLVKYGAKFSKALVPTVLSAFLEKHIDSKTVREAFKELSKEAVSIFEEEVNEYANKKKGLEEFKRELEAYVSKLEKKPLVFFIDELDRCNPKYAVEFLEIIKHFFSVPGIVFVLSIDKGNLINSIKGYFGSQSLNGNEYLRRFIDVEYSLPIPKIVDYIPFMFRKTGMGEFIYNDNRRFDHNFRNEDQYFENLAIALFSNKDVNLRQVEKILVHTNLVLKTFPIRAHTFPNALFTLIAMRFLDFELYSKIKNNELTPQELMDKLFDFINPKVKVKRENNFPFVASLILVLYCKNENNKKYNIWKGEGETKELNLTSKFNENSNSEFYGIQGYVEVNEKDYLLRDLNLDMFFITIELLSELRRLKSE